MRKYTSNSIDSKYINENKDIIVEMGDIIKPLVRAIQTTLSNLGMGKENVLKALEIDEYDPIHIEDVLKLKNTNSNIINQNVIEFINENQTNIHSLIYVVYNSENYNDKFVVSLLHDKIYDLMVVNKALTEILNKSLKNDN